MGREIRRVIPNWEHPRYTEEDAPRHNLIGRFKPLYDDSYGERRRVWMDGLLAWERGEGRPEGIDCDYWEWEGGPPDREYYRPDWTAEEATWFQFYETVSEGTPLSPPFATPDELVDWLVNNKDYWGYGPVDRESAARFVNAGWAPSMVIIGGEVHGPGIDALPE